MRFRIIDLSEEQVYHFLSQSFCKRLVAEKQIVTQQVFIQEPGSPPSKDRESLYEWINYLHKIDEWYSDGENHKEQSDGIRTRDVVKETWWAEIDDLESLLDLIELSELPVRVCRISGQPTLAIGYWIDSNKWEREE